MNEDIRLPFDLPAVARKNVSAAFDGGRITSDGGVMLLAQAERRLGVADQLARVIPTRAMRTGSSICRPKFSAHRHDNDGQPSGHRDHGDGVVAVLRPVMILIWSAPWPFLVGVGGLLEQAHWSCLCLPISPEAFGLFPLMR